MIDATVVLGAGVPGSPDPTTVLADGSGDLATTLVSEVVQLLSAPTVSSRPTAVARTRFFWLEDQYMDMRVLFYWTDPPIGCITATIPSRSYAKVVIPALGSTTFA
jgi:hypothetical protein